MAVNRKRFYLGRPGFVQALESFTMGSNPDSPEELIGSERRSLSGRLTRDVFAIKRSWTTTWERLQEPQYQRLRALQRTNPSFGALRLVDLRNRNLLRAGISMAGSDWGTDEDFEVTNTGVNSPGAMVWEANTWPAAIEEFIVGNPKWTVALVGTPQLRDRETIVVWPGETYRFSFWAAGSGGSIVASVRGFNKSGAEVSTVSGSTIALSGTPATATRHEYVYTPSATTVEAQFGIRYTGPASPNHTVHTAGWQVQVDEPLAAWVPGVGTPEVLMQLATSYPLPGWYHCQINFKEV